MVKLTDKYRTDVALFRYGILAPLISGTWEGTSDSQFFKEAASKTYILPNGKEKIIHPIPSIDGIWLIQKMGLML